MRKKNDTGWAKLNGNEKAKALRTVCDTNLVDHQRATIEEIHSWGKGVPFLKVSFTTQSEIWTFTKALNAKKSLYGYIIFPHGTM